MLSDFPDCILLHILGFLNTKEAVQTCLLSTRWKHLWKHLPTLTFRFSYSHFNNHNSFTNFVNRFLSLPDSSSPLNALDLKCEDFIAPQLLERIVTYTISHNVNRLHLDCPIPYFPPSLISCHSLTSLALRCPFLNAIFLNSLNLPALTYLKLIKFSFCSGNEGRVEPFSTFNKLNTLILEKCTVQDEQTLCISSTTIVNLSINTFYRYYLNIVLFAPSLCTFAFTGIYFHKLTWSHLSSIKQVKIDLLLEENYYVETSFSLLDWLRGTTDIKSLTVTPRILWVPFLLL